MIFTSFAFLVFFPAVCILFYLIPHRFRWMYLLAVSYYFYVNWQPIYALLLFATTTVTYVCARFIGRGDSRPAHKRLYLVAGCLLPLGFLAFFKYYNFINGAVFDTMEWCGVRWPLPEMKLLLPLGISFYTFMAVGYLTDVYRGTVPAERNFGLYALFIAFFPQVTSGPIGRAGTLLHQLKSSERLSHDNIMEGLKQMAWGYFMKLCVADRLAIYVDAVYANVEHHNGTTLLLASVFYSIQIYCDFAGYSLIAIGAARMMGIRLMENFRRPYFSKNVREFWSRWHISLSTWFRDYVYIPLGGNRVSQLRHMSNLLTTFLISGLWHGANWTFLIWGGMHGIFQIGENLWKKYVTTRLLRIQFPVVLRIAGTFAAVDFAWILFRAPDLPTAFGIIGRIFSSVGVPFTNFSVFAMGGFSVLLLFVKELTDEYGIGMRVIHAKNLFVSHVSTAALCSYIVLFGVLDGGQFIYFQF